MFNQKKKKGIMLLNLTNHPSEKWTDEQKNVAKQMFGGIIDMQFPDIDPTGNEEYISNLTNEYLKKILSIKNSLPNNEELVVHIMGEQTFCFSLINKLLENDILCVASTTQRIAVEKDGIKTSVFKFCKFRYYINF